MTLLKDKVAIVTGAAAGIGRGIADLFADEGAAVYVLDVDEAGAEQAVAAINDRGGVAHAFRTDISKPATITPAIDDALARYGHIDILVNNAGIYPRRSFDEMTEQEWDETQNVNVKGVFHMTKLVLPHMRRSGSGKIVNISSVTFHLGYPNLTHYVASKGAVLGFTRALAREIGPQGVHVNAVTPGAIETEGEKVHANPDDIAKIVTEQCIQRRIVPLDVARVCLFLASELSDGMTGQTLNVDGGLVMY
ncbi:MAG: 3-oxoacyl-ACP reductase FabG [Acidobacteria bacterium]|nr:3-oxoacyl-ACP reductase FabG [Acidobacteriota bacterium]